jgi:hypothetical protein
MGCDYYIEKLLRIYFDNAEFLDIELEKEKREYNYYYDEDEEDYEEKVKEYINRCLTPEMEPIVIYRNHTFNRPLFETKYKTLIENKIAEHGKKWENIVSVVKEEERYKRE